MGADSLALVNGALDGVISPQDRGLALGDGVFRTLRMEQGQPIWWEDHYEKLEADCRLLGLHNPTRTEWEQDIAWVGARLPDAVLRLSVTRGPGPRGYRLPEYPLPTRITVATPLPAFPDPLAESGAHLRLCDLRLARQPRLAGAKHLNRLENILARAEWDDPNIDEGLLLDETGGVVSGVMSNVFIWHENILTTPLLDQCGVAGVTRARLLRLARQRGIAVRETALSIDDVRLADAVFLTNSLIRIRFVSRFENCSWSRPPLFDVLREALA